MPILCFWLMLYITVHSESIGTQHSLNDLHIILYVASPKIVHRDTLTLLKCHSQKSFLLIQFSRSAGAHCRKLTRQAAPLGYMIKIMWSSHAVLFQLTLYSENVSFSFNRDTSEIIKYMDSKKAHCDIMTRVRGTQKSADVFHHLLC